MGGQSQQQQNANQNTSQQNFQNSNYGGNQTQYLSPWQQTQPLLQNIIGGLNTQPTGINPQQQSAIDILMQQAQQGNPFTSQITGVTGGLLGGAGLTQFNPQIGAAINQLATTLPGISSTLNAQLAPIINQPLGSISPALQGMLDTARSDVTNQVNQQFAAAGRDMSGLNQQALGRGITAAQDPILANQYNTQIGQLMQAAGLQAQTGQAGANSLFSGILGGSQAMTGNQQAAVNAMLQGLTTGVPSSLNALSFTPQMMLAAQGLQQGIPQQNLQYLASLGLPLAQTFGTQTGTTSGTAGQSGAQSGTNIGQTNTTIDPSALQQALGWSQVFSNLFGGGGGGGGGGGANAAKLLNLR